MKFLFVVPARIGSKGIREKNIHPLNGKPLIFYTLNQINQIGFLANTVVSSDSEKIIDLTKKDFPQTLLDIRPNDLCSDNSSSDSVLLYIAKKYHGYGYTHLIYLEPTFPLRNHQSILDVMSLLKKGERSVFTIVEDNSIFGYVVDKKFEPLIKNEPRRRQERKIKYKEVSSIYGLEIVSFLKRKTISDPNGLPLIVDKISSHDINNHEDLLFAEFILDQK